MKLHDLKPAPGSRKERIRAGRGISAGKGKTAGRGTKGQKARAGGTIPAWFEGGQTPAHMRLPKLHGFKRRFRIEYQVINVGRISEYAAAGRFGVDAGSAPLTVNTEVLRAAGLIASERMPVKVLGHGDVGVKLFVAADAFTKSAREKIEAAGGFVQATAMVVEKGETKQDRADARAVIAEEKQKASDAADAARWAAPSSAPAPAARAAPDAEAAGKAPARGRSGRPRSRAEVVEAAASDDTAEVEPADGAGTLEVEATAADTDSDIAAPVSSDEETEAEDSDEAPVTRRRSRKSTDTSDQ